MILNNNLWSYGQLAPFNGKRAPAVAGLFYPANKDELYESIHSCFTSDLGPGVFPSNRSSGIGSKKQTSSASEKKSVECIIVPHAGYVYSGPVAAHAFLRAFEFMNSSSAKEITAIVLGPNHYGIGSGLSLSPAKSWETPLGEVRVNEKMSKEFSEESDVLDYDLLAHSREHSIEVQVPFLQVMGQLANKEISIVPICLMLQDKETTEQLSQALLKILQRRETGNTVVLGSSDLTHYEPQEEASSKDSKLLSKVSDIDILGFYNVLERLNVTSCGYGAISSLMFIAKGLGYHRGDLLKYATSADRTGDKSSVVGYSSVEFI